ncbi:Alpha/Beta hydrolase protein [Mycena belliarum]|uniref:carboxypeptidase C n=1 Tax=Mycena belliarum TaxID=1033014 RepID=A0AAD6U6R8_9AGAR|nr:Alpha/Beta hydrolase protein [Mycena belliae]
MLWRARARRPVGGAALRHRADAYQTTHCSRRAHPARTRRCPRTRGRVRAAVVDSPVCPRVGGSYFCCVLNYILCLRETSTERNIQSLVPSLAPSNKLGYSPGVFKPYGKSPITYIAEDYRRQLRLTGHQLDYCTHHSRSPNSQLCNTYLKPIGAGFSFGSRVNSSRTAAYDVYDFLQKFFVLFPDLAGNKFVVSSGSYGGVYVPHVATVIHEQNMLIARGRGRPGAIPIHLEALIVSNPFSNPSTHFRWMLQYRCMDHHVFNSTDCTRLYAELPACLDSIDLAYERPTVENRRTAWTMCDALNYADTHGTVFEDIRRQARCTPNPNDTVPCHPEFGWVIKILDDPATKAALGLSRDSNFEALNMEVNAEFAAAGDMVQRHDLLYPPLLAAGIRVLHYVGAQDANCAWPGVFSFLKLLPTPFQSEFVSAPDVPWPEKGIATVRSVGSGAGDMTYILLQGAGHFPALAKAIVEKWVANEPFLTKGGEV